MIGGNIVTASPISDLNPTLVAAGAILNVTSHNSEQKHKINEVSSSLTTFCIAPPYVCKMDESFFVSYRKTVLKHDEIVVSLLIPWTQEVASYLDNTLPVL